MSSLPKSSKKYPLSEENTVEQGPQGTDKEIAPSESDASPQGTTQNTPQKSASSPQPVLLNRKQRQKNKRKHRRAQEQLRAKVERGDTVEIAGTSGVEVTHTQLLSLLGGW